VEVGEKKSDKFLPRYFRSCFRERRGSGTFCIFVCIAPSFSDFFLQSILCRFFFHPLFPLRFCWCYSLCVASVCAFVSLCLQEKKVMDFGLIFVSPSRVFALMYVVCSLIFSCACHVSVSVLSVCKCVRVCVAFPSVCFFVACFFLKCDMGHERL